MINTIKEYFEGLLANSPDDNKNNKSLELATAVLMIEISLADDHIDDRERDEIKKQMTTGFDLDDQTIQELIEAAEKEVDHSVSLYEFTSLLNDKLPMEDRVAVVKNLWRIAYADNVLDKYEEYYIRKVADLLYVAHSDFIKSKLDAAN
ncbi:MAG: TerB family tellurite resistance protein [Gammaproteobacteria bacterium]